MRKGMMISRDETDGFCPMPAQKEADRRAELVGRDYRLSFPYNPDINAKIKKVPGWRWESWEKRWYVPANRLADQVLSGLGFALPNRNAGCDFSFMEGLGLRPYQQEGIRLLAGEFGLNGLLADEMGLGKTAQAICAVRAKRCSALPALAIVPASVKANWEKEIHMWHPDATVEIISGKGGKGFERKADFTIVNYDILASRMDELKGKFRTVILDECHKIKNSNTAWTKAAKKIAQSATYKICISGTPITSRPIEFYNVLKLLAPDTFRNYHWFGMQFCDGKILNIRGKEIMDFRGSSNAEELNRLVAPFMIRRYKKDVLKDLPDMQRIMIPVEIDLKKYLKIEMEAMMELDPLVAIGKCKQAAIEAKLKPSIDWIRDYLENGQKLVVFGHHKETLDALEKAFPDSVRYDGDTSPSKKLEAIDRFQNDPNCRLFIGSIKACGEAITLTAASATLTLELDWVPGRHLQAEARVHRIGLEASSCEAYYLIAKGTIDETIMDMLDKKMQDVSIIVDGKEMSRDETLKSLMVQYWEERIAPKPKKAKPKGPKM